MTLYDVLGVTQHADKDTIKKAYRDLAKKYHPDANGGDSSAEERFKEISKAYTVLSDDGERIKYDASLVNPFAGQQGFNFDGNFSDLFNQFFGGDPRQRRGQNVTVNMTLTFDEAYQGCRRTISTGADSFEVNIPAGIKPGMKLKMAGKGHVNPYNPSAGPGDMIISFEVLHDTRFVMRGDDLYVQKNIPWWDMVTGTKIQVETMKGSIKVTVPPNSFNGKTLRIKDQGWPIYNSNQRGALMIQLNSAYPSLNEEQLQLVNELKDKIIGLERTW